MEETMRSRTVIALAAGIILLAAPAAQADVIHACVNKKGSMRVVSDLSQCKPSENSLSWNQQGPPGEPGDPGEPGADGPPGPSLRLFDGNGVELGPLTDFDTEIAHATFYSAQLDAIVRVRLETRTIWKPLPRNVFFTELNCQGVAYQSLPIPGDELLQVFLAVVTPSDGVRFFAWTT